MKQDIHICNSCGIVFEVSDNNEPICPVCGLSKDVEVYTYNDLEDQIKLREIMVRLSRNMQTWFFITSSQMIRDLLYIEVELVNHSYSVQSSLNNLISNTAYMLNLVNKWKSASFSSPNAIVYFKGEPGCLITEENWEMVTSNLLTVQNNAEEMLAIMEACWLGEHSDGETAEPSWESLEGNTTDMLHSTIKVYRFFKTGVETNITL